MRHASRAVRLLRGYTSGGRVSNNWIIYPRAGNRLGKLGVIPHKTTARHLAGVKVFGHSRRSSVSISLLVG